MKQEIRAGSVFGADIDEAHIFKRRQNGGRRKRQAFRTLIERADAVVRKRIDQHGALVQENETAARVAESFQTRKRCGTQRAAGRNENHVVRYCADLKRETPPLVHCEGRSDSLIKSKLRLPKRSVSVKSVKCFSS